MAIRDIVSRGFGNGTYDPGVNDLPVRGFTIGPSLIPDAPTAPGLQYTLKGKRLHYTLEDNRLHHTLPINRLHYTLEE